MRHAPLETQLPLGTRYAKTGHTLHAEWTKARTAGGTFWLLLGVIVATVALGAVVSAATKCSSATCGQDPAKVSLAGLYLGQAVVAITAVLAIGGEYGTGMILVTLTAVPGRSAMLAAKAAILTGSLLVAATIAVLGSVLAGRLLLPGNGFTTAHGYQLLSLTDGPYPRAAVGSVLYLVLIGLLGLGIATAIRDSAVAVGVVLGLLYLFPVLEAAVSSSSWHRHLEQISPMTAGLAVQATSSLASSPISPWAGLGVLAAWAAGALLVGALVLRLRDA